MLHTVTAGDDATTRPVGGNVGSVHLLDERTQVAHSLTAPASITFGSGTKLR